MTLIKQDVRPAKFIFVTFQKEGIHCCEVWIEVSEDGENGSFIKY